MYESGVIAFTCLANWLDIFSICHVKKHVYSSAGENWDVYAGHRLNLLAANKVSDFPVYFLKVNMLLLDYQKSVQPFPFLGILLKNEKIIAQILQLQCLLFGEIVSIRVEDGS